MIEPIDADLYDGVLEDILTDLVTVEEYPPEYCSLSIQVLYNSLLECIPTESNIYKGTNRVDSVCYKAKLIKLNTLSEHKYLAEYHLNAEYA